jgi:glycine cleavage system aminomethyltransferase T
MAGGTRSLHAGRSPACAQKVGLIDVSTLGGLDVRGPDAAELLERLYTFGFAKLPVGRTRYALMTNEHGVVIDDGVCARLGEQHFYVTATTSGVDRIYQQMLKWNAQWRLDVDITNVTAALAAVNLAGPLSRQVLAKVCDDVDLAAGAFLTWAYARARWQALLHVSCESALSVSWAMKCTYQRAMPSGCGIP